MHYLRGLTQPLGVVYRLSVARLTCGRGWLCQCFVLLILGLACLHTQAAPSLNGADISGSHFGQGLAAQNLVGQRVTLSDYRGKVLLLFFGFTRCADICPTTMAQLAQLQQSLEPKEAQQVQVFMVAIDPERDNQHTLNSYVKAFDEHFDALWGTPEQMQQLAKSFKVHVKKNAYTNGNYDIEHSASIYVIDKKGESVLLFKPGMDVDEMLADIRVLLAQ
ncbi:SCO family protein [Brackiella oedipodis]|uniref:SCO family protein n=1 Tax=Brackiella oedipodis TaxID=124225 RepID=UPI0006862C6D|nr:SCO family protein [Brackiella oedipodis]